MLIETVALPFEGKNNASLTMYCTNVGDNCLLKIRPTILLCPGGGYRSVSLREGEPVALQFNAMGYNVAVLTYSVENDAQFPQPLCELALAMAFLKKNFEKYCIDPKRIFTCGFSAGGHLALSLGVYWDKEWLAKKVGVENELLRPTAQILGYPVVTDDPEYSHLGSILRATGGLSAEEITDMLALEKHVSENTPPTFLWTTAMDGTVPYKNSLLLANALEKHQIPQEFHLFGWGPHGASLCTPVIQSIKNLEKSAAASHVNAHNAVWVRLCHEWLQFFFA